MVFKVGDKVPGWIKLHRQLLESTVFDNSDLLKVWVWCLLKATHRKHKQLVGLQEVMLEEGQFIFGRKKASEELRLSESKVYRFMKFLKSENNISMKSNNKFTIVTIEKWTLYQDDDKENEQQMNNKRTTNEQQMNTNKNVKNVKNIYKDIVEYLNEKTKKNFKYTTKKTKNLIDTRLKEGFSLEDFKKVIDIKTAQWLDDKKMNSYLRPETLFGTKFEGYLNESTGPQNNNPNDDPYAGMKVYTGGE